MGNLNFLAQAAHPGRAAEDGRMTDETVPAIGNSHLWEKLPVLLEYHTKLNFTR